MLSSFKKRYPHIDLVLRSNTNGVVHNSVLSGEQEIAITSRKPNSSLLYAEPYVSLRRVAFVARNSPLAKKNALNLSDLEKVPLIIRGAEESNSSIYLMLNNLKKQGHKLNIAMHCESPEAVQTAVRQNLGIGFLYYDAVRTAVERGSFKIIQIRGLNMEGQTCLVYHNQRPLSHSAEEFLKLLRSWRDNEKTKKANKEGKAQVLASLVPLLYTAHRLSPLVSHALHISRRLLIRI